jgi:hypothetical protein
MFDNVRDSCSVLAFGKKDLGTGWGQPLKTNSVSITLLD